LGRLDLGVQAVCKTVAPRWAM